MTFMACQCEKKYLYVREFSVATHYILKILSDNIFPYIAEMF